MSQGYCCQCQMNANQEQVTTESDCDSLLKEPYKHLRESPYFWSAPVGSSIRGENRSGVRICSPGPGAVWSHCTGSSRADLGVVSFCICITRNAKCQKEELPEVLTALVTTDWFWSILNQICVSAELLRSSFGNRAVFRNEQTSVSQWYTTAHDTLLGRGFGPRSQAH